MIEKDGHSYRMLIGSVEQSTNSLVKYEDDVVSLTRNRSYTEKQVESYVLRVKGNRKVSLTDTRVLVPVKGKIEGTRVLFSDTPNKVYLIEVPSGSGNKVYVFGRAEYELQF